LKLVRLTLLVLGCGGVYVHYLNRVDSLLFAIVLFPLAIILIPWGFHTMWEEYLSYLNIKRLLEQEGKKLISLKVMGDRCDAIFDNGKGLESCSYDLLHGGQSLQHRKIVPPPKSGAA